MSTAFNFASGGFTRRAFQEGNVTDPVACWVWLDGGDIASGENILLDVTPSLDEVFLAPDGLHHTDGTATFIKSWVPPQEVMAPGATRDSDLDMLVDLCAYAGRAWPTLRYFYVGGYSGGGGMVQEMACRGKADVFDGFFVFKRPLHESQAPSGVALLTLPQKPLLLWLSNNDVEHNDAVDHLGLTGTVAAYRRAYGTADTPTYSVGTIDGHQVRRYYYGGSGLFSFALQIGGQHDWVDGVEVQARRFLRSTET